MTAIRRSDRRGGWWVDFRFRGKRIRRRSKDQSQRGAVAFEQVLRAQLLSDIDVGRISPIGPAPFFRDFADRWMHVYVGPRNRPTTIRDKRIILSLYLLPAFGHLRLDEINAAKVDAFLADRVAQGLRPKTVNNHLTVLHSALSVAVEWGELRSLPRFHWKRVGEQPYRFLSEDECRGVLGATDSDFWRTFMLFLLHTGARFGEGAALPWENVLLDRPAPVVRIRQACARSKLGETKTGKTREIPLNSTVVGALRRLPRTGPYVFQRHESRFMDPGSTNKFLHRFCLRAHVNPFGWHVFRHTFATNLTSRGVPLVVVKDLLGHTDIRMTARYAHATPGAMTAAVGLLAADPQDENMSTGTDAISNAPRPNRSTPQNALLSWHGTQNGHRGG